MWRRGRGRGSSGGFGSYAGARADERERSSRERSSPYGDFRRRLRRVRFDRDADGGGGTSERSGTSGNHVEEAGAGSSAPAKHERQRHPPHLRGREIGMWYSAQSRNKKSVLGLATKKASRLTELMTFNLPDKTEDDIEEMLESVEKSTERKGNVEGWPGLRSGVGSSSSTHFVDRYKHVKGSCFKNQFLENLERNALVAGPPSSATASAVPDAVKKVSALDDELLMNLVRKEAGDDAYRKMLDFRRKLPAHTMRAEILDCVLNNQVVVLSGETGCGKTTQVPQFILDDYIESGRGSECRILCTQPRRISAISVAERVAQERAERCGESAGFQIRLQAELPRRQGSILYCTSGILVTKLQSDPLISDYTHVLLDEIHERDVLSDFLLALVKDILPLRPTLKVVLMSATLNAQLFSEYFDGCPMLHIPGLTFPVEEFYLEDVLARTGFEVRPVCAEKRRWGRDFRKSAKEREEAAKYNELVLPTLMNMLEKKFPIHVISSMKTFSCETPDVILDVALETIRYICQCEGEGAVLVFFPGWDDISKLHKRIEADRFFQPGKFLVLPLHSMMPTVNQRQVFDRPPKGVRKIIIATNIAETSITIDDVVFVVDSGKIKMNTFDEQLNVQTLASEWVSRANARQRKGRAGRVQPGKCYHLFSRAREATFADFPLPEMRRVRLEELCLQIKLLKLGEIEPFLSKVIEPPTPKALELSVALLRDLNALDENEDLTPLGFHLARLPTDPQTGKMLLMAAIFSCVDPIATITAALSFKDPFFTPLGKEKEVDRKRREFAEDSRSDHLMVFNAFRAWEAARDLGWRAEARFCQENFLSGNTLNMLREMKKQFCGYLEDMKFLSSAEPKDSRSNRNSNKMGLVRAVICAGLYPNVAFAKSRRNPYAPAAVRTLRDGQKVSFHPKSVLANERNLPFPWIVFKLKQKSNGVSLHDASVASPCSLLFFGQKVGAEPLPTDDDGEEKEGPPLPARPVGYPSDPRILSADGQIRFLSSGRAARLVQRLRLSLDDLLDYKITHPSPSNWDSGTKEGALLKAIAELLSAEAKISGLSYAEEEEGDDDDDCCDNAGEEPVGGGRYFDQGRSGAKDE